jgi:hypothetical protein
MSREVIKMTEKDFKFTDPKMQNFADTNREAIAKMMGVEKEDVNCKGLRIYFVVESKGIMASEGMFVDEFDPEAYIDDGEQTDDEE